MWAINYMLHNGTPVTEAVFIEYELDVVAADSPTGRALTPLRPVWFDVQNGTGAWASPFSYLPGDLGLPDPFGLPPQVRRGETLLFGNLDAAAGMLHTITACAPPCTGATGVSYPLADGPVALDSGQLG